MFWELLNLQHMRKCGNFSVFIALAFHWFHCAKYSSAILALQNVQGTLECYSKLKDKLGLKTSR